MLFPPSTVLRALTGWSCLANTLLGRGDLKAWSDPSRERNHWEKYKRWLKPLHVPGKCQPPSHQCPQFHWAWLGLPSWKGTQLMNCSPMLYPSSSVLEKQCLIQPRASQVPFKDMKSDFSASEIPPVTAWSHVSEKIQWSSSVKYGQDLN